MTILSGIAVTLLVLLVGLRRARVVARARQSSPGRNPKVRWTKNEPVSIELPLFVDMVRMALDTGLNAQAAMAIAAQSTRGRLALEVDELMAVVRGGQRFLDALDCIRVKNAALAPLASVMLSAAQYGAPLHASLDRLSTELRASQLQDAERAARRLSVQLVFPVACCILPAFALVVVVPLLAGTISGLASSMS